MLYSIPWHRRWNFACTRQNRFTMQYADYPSFAGGARPNAYIYCVSTNRLFLPGRAVLRSLLYAYYGIPGMLQTAELRWEFYCGAPTCLNDGTSQRKRYIIPCMIGSEVCFQVLVRPFSSICLWPIFDFFFPDLLFARHLVSFDVPLRKKSNPSFFSRCVNGERFWY